MSDTSITVIYHVMSMTLLYDLILNYFASYKQYDSPKPVITQQHIYHIIKYPRHRFACM